ncbi:MAG: hypothetical protein MJZ75_02200 [Paludibacteraceae bacterium]|nr:hypothetical protein [Paludibacteraceae bacterium]
MKKQLLLSLLLILTGHLLAIDAGMFVWKSHLAYGEVITVVDANDRVYGLAGNALFSVDKQTEEVTTYSKQDGMNGADIVQIAYDTPSKTLLVVYADGLVDFYKNGTFSALTDLQQKNLSKSKSANSIFIADGLAYLGMPFGIMVIDINKHLIKDTYYIGTDGSDINVLSIALSADSLFALSDNTLFTAALADNRMDYRNWNQTKILQKNSAYTSVAVWNNELFAVVDNQLLHRNNGQWEVISADRSYRGLRNSDGRLYVMAAQAGIYVLNDMYQVETLPSVYVAQDISIHNGAYWLATATDGIVLQTSSGTQTFHVDGPLVNIPYRLKIANQRLYVVPGQRWADENPKRDADIMIYDITNDTWQNISSYQVYLQLDSTYIFDLMNVAVDPFDPEHFYVTTFGTGLLECYGTKVLHQYGHTNSSLESAAPTSPMAHHYVRTDGALFDEMGNLWLLNVEKSNLVHVANPAQLQSAKETGIGNWYKMNVKTDEGTFIAITPGEMFIDNRNSHYKWIPNLRGKVGLILLDDNGTPQNSSDDVSVFHGSFTDQDGKVVKPEVIYAVAQDKEGTLWVALSTGVITIPSTVDFKHSDRCERIKIARNDGTNLADYLLETEQITSIAVDGANRKWFGTAASGVFLISADGQETIHHFTSDNSPLLSNDILSLAIEPITGKVFIGTGKGLMSYQSDAASPFEDYSSIYAYPNPIRPDYDGLITITGLMDETVVHIVDNAGNLVCETRSNGGLAVWDGKTADGRRVASGVYSVFCNEVSDNRHAVVKILVMH